jgi:hypothetical protein
LNPATLGQGSGYGNTSHFKENIPFGNGKACFEKQSASGTIHIHDEYSRDSKRTRLPENISAPFTS